MEPAVASERRSDGAPDASDPAADGPSTSTDRRSLDRESTAASVLEAAHAAVARGEVDLARSLALSLLDSPVERTDPRSRARALSCLAHCDRILSKSRRASDAAREAAQLFERMGDTAGEIAALITLAHATMLIGRIEEALEAALLSVELSDPGVPTPQLMLAHNCLGLAYCWSGDHVRADASLETAASVARRCVPEISFYQPRLNQVWVESSRLVAERYQTGTMGSLDRLQALMADCRDLVQGDSAVLVMPGVDRMGRSVALASAVLVEIWSGDHSAATRTLASAVASLPAGRTWLQAFVHWCAAELAWARGDWPVAEQCLVKMRETAIDVEHIQLACMAELLLVQVFERQQRHDAAQRACRSLRQRERQAMADGVGSREALVAHRVRARRSERRLQQALEVSRQFERWSLEDALTGIANRRHFEQTLNDRLGRSPMQHRALSVAMVDVDRFKSVNDGFSHSVGDRVLKTVAAILSSHVRGQDLPARWAGDEFVVLFDGANAAEAAQVCERIGDAVSGFDWASVAAGLSVSVSIGVSEVGQGDTAATVMQRSDESMYRKKSQVGAAG